MNIPNRPSLAMALGLCLCLGLSSVASAQNPYGNRATRNLARPTTSPYLNLFNNGGGRGGFGLNYYQQVRPQQQFRGAFQRQANQITSLQAAQQNANAAGTSQAPTSGLNTTGHPTSFLSTQGYFNAGPR